jgi:hypothetical protein
VKTARLTTIEAAPSILLSRWIAGLYVCVCDGAGRNLLVLEDRGLMEQIRHQHQLYGTRHQQRDECDADSKSPEGAAII